MPLDRTILLPAFTLTAAVIFCAAFAMHYPLSTSFPIGGDPVRYIARAQQVTVDAQRSIIGGLTTLSQNSKYPGAISLMAASQVLPISWPDRFTWLIAAAHLATGLTIGWLLYKISGWRAAAAGVAIWALTTTAVGEHFEDGTLAQLLSLPLLILSLERFMVAALKTSLALLLLTLTLHPISGLMAVLIIFFSSLILIFARLPLSRSQRQATIVSLIVVTIILIITVLPRLLKPPDYEPEYRGISLINLIRTPFGPFMLMAPVGLILLIKQLRDKPIVVVTLFIFTVTAILFAFNDHLGISLVAFRFQTYLIILATIGSGLALPHLVRLTFTRPLVRATSIIMLFTITALASWNSTNKTFGYYESPGNYARLHITEQAAIDWLAEHAGADSRIVSSTVNRHSEWIPVLTNLQWQGLNETDQLFQAQGNELRQLITANRYTYLVLFTKREPVAANFRADADLYPVVFENKGATIIDLTQPYE